MDLAHLNDDTQIDRMTKKIMRKHRATAIRLGQEESTCNIGALTFWPAVQIGMYLAIFAIMSQELDMDKVQKILGPSD